MVLLFYTTYISVDLAHHKIFRAKVGKGGINLINLGSETCIHHELLNSENEVSLF